MSQEVIRFGRFELDVKKAELCQDGIPLSTQEQPFPILKSQRGHPGLETECPGIPLEYGEGDPAPLATHELTESLKPATADATGEQHWDGCHIDRYQILRELGRGGMGSVYLAVRTDDVYRSPVALKVVRPEVGSEEVIRRFRQEREILAALDHPNIGRLLDGGCTSEGLPYFVMDYIEGQRIDLYCDERRLPIHERLKLFATVCSAVEHAHEQGLVHRDLKPANILVTNGGVVKLLDFGIAKMLRVGQSEPTVPITRTGMLLMTPEYASPEQVNCENVGRTSDVYSLGVILYELLTGHRPYRMRNRMIYEVMRVISEEEPTLPSVVVTETEERPPVDGSSTAITPHTVSRMRETTLSELRRSLGGDLDNIVMMALRKNPAARYPTAGSLGEDVKRRLDRLPVSARGSIWWYRAGRFLERYKWWVVAAICAIGGIATGMIRINPVAAGIALAFLAFFLVCQRGRVAFFGAEFASPFRLTITAACTFLGIAALTWLMIFSDTLTGFLLVLFGALGFRNLLRWPFRDRWAGLLLLKAGRPLPRFLVAYRLLLVILVLFFAASAMREGLRGQWLNLSCTFMFSVFTAWCFCCLGKVEIRARGVLVYGKLFRWHKLRSYAWERSDHKVAVLKLQPAGVSLLRHWRLPVMPESKDAIAAILDEHLSDWPERLLDLDAGLGGHGQAS